jgi:DNA replication and repair protein RecF
VTLARALRPDLTPAAPADRPGLAIARLALRDFRCYREAAIETDPRPVVLTGPNGAGKTNLLEAVSFLAPGRGLRRARLAEVERRPTAPEAGPAPGPWAVAARLRDRRGDLVELGTGRDGAAGETERRLVKLDGAFQRGQSALAEHVQLVWLTPQMDRLFLDGAGERRRFLDRMVYGFDPEHAARLNAYDHLLRERGRLLQGDLPAPPGGESREAWLAGLEEQMAGLGVAIAAARRDLLRRLVAVETGEGAFPAADLALTGELDRALDAGPALEAEDWLRARFAGAHRQDAETGGSREGPQRSDLAVGHRGRGRSARDCSTGEQKALLIALVLAFARALAAERGAAPLLLLDEVAAHLDETRRQALFAELLDLGAQAWLTGTDAGLFAGLGEAAQFFAVEEARLAPARPPQ